MREIKFRAFWRDTLKQILDFSKEYLIDACNDEVFIVDQFTGLKDKNGKEIYEGDIFSKVPINELGGNIQYFYVVVWSSTDLGYRCKQYVLDQNGEDEYYWREKHNGYFDHLSMVKMYNHVIGNIHENKNLLP